MCQICVRVGIVFNSVFIICEVNLIKRLLLFLKSMITTLVCVCLCTCVLIKRFEEYPVFRCITDGCKTCQLCIVSSRRLKTRMTHHKKLTRRMGARAQTGPYMACLGCFLLLLLLVLVSTACFEGKNDSCNCSYLHICS